MTIETPHSPDVVVYLEPDPGPGVPRIARTATIDGHHYYLSAVEPVVVRAQPAPGTVEVTLTVLAHDVRFEEASE